MKALVGAFNQEKALVGVFSVIVQPVVEPMEHYTALISDCLMLHLALDKELLFAWNSLLFLAIRRWSRGWEHSLRINTGCY